MARKRLSDLLREEGQKSTAQTDSKKKTQETTPPSPAEVDTPAVDTVEVEAVAVTAEVIAAQADQVDDFVAELRDAATEPEETPAANPDSTAIAELEETITQLKAKLATADQTAQTQADASQQQVADLQETVADLQAKITAQETTIQQLQKELQQVESLKSELDTAKQTILQLTQTKEKSTASPSIIPSTRAAEPELEPSTAKLVMPTAKPTQIERPKLHQLELRKLLDHPTQPGSLPPMPSERISSPAKASDKSDREVKLPETDVGWMD